MRQTSLDVAHGLPDVAPRERVAVVFERVHQRERERLLDHGRRVTIGDSSKLVATSRRVQLGIMLLLGEVELGDVLAVILDRHSKDDLAAKTARTDDRFIKDLRSVCRSDEEDVVTRSPKDWNAQADLGAVRTDLPRNKESVE